MANDRPAGLNENILARYARALGARDLSQLDSAIAALRAAHAALEHEHEQTGQRDQGAGPSALDDAFAAVGALYADLDGDGSREVLSHRSAVYDCCVRQVGEARAGRAEGLAMAIELLVQLRTAEQVAPSEPRIRRQR